MVRRPRSTTITVWFLIVTSILSVLSLWRSYDDPLVQQVMAASPIPMVLQIQILVAGLVGALVCGIGILKGKNWARWIYVGLGGARPHPRASNLAV